MRSVMSDSAGASARRSYAWQSRRFPIGSPKAATSSPTRCRREQRPNLLSGGVMGSTALSVIGEPRARAVQLRLPGRRRRRSRATACGDHALARDLVNTPANDMSPERWRRRRSIGRRYGARIAYIVGDEL